MRVLRAVGLVRVALAELVAGPLGADDRKDLVLGVGGCVCLGVCVCSCLVEAQNLVDGQVLGASAHAFSFGGGF